MHVDGFRFDLASALARELHAVDRLGASFDIIHQDPVMSQIVTAAASYSVAGRSVAVFRLVEHPGAGGRA